MKTKQTRSSMFNVGSWMVNVRRAPSPIFHLPSPISILFLLLLLAMTDAASAATRYVWQDSPSPGPPYTNWTTAAHVIQDAVDLAQTGDTVLVAGGVYATGGRAVGTNLLVNRVAIDRAITVESLMGPEVTIIQGYQVPGTTSGDGAIRCVYLADGATLAGFTLTNGATLAVDGWPDQESESSGGGVWCESQNALVTNCVLTGNSAHMNGGGAYLGTLNNCSVTYNSANYQGGGASGSTLNNCTLTSNSAGGGGGASGGTLKNCTLTGNSAGEGGGATGGTLNNCTLTGNSAGGGGGAFLCRLNNCTLTGNSAGQGGGVGGAWDLPSTLNNCIVYFNDALDGANYSLGIRLNYCCTTPMPSEGVGNISLDPQLADAFHVSATSPCRGAGSAAYATGTDIDGEAWANPPSIGCDEYHAGAVTGPLRVGVVAAFTNVAVGFAVDLTARIEGHASASVWDFGDGVLVSNRLYASHAWTAPGDIAVVLRAYNESNPAGVSATVTVHVVTQPVHYVAAENVTPVPPYASWATAATNVQDAVDAATVPGALVLVTNGVYTGGGRAGGTSALVNRVAVDKPLTLRSVNGPEFTVIQGHQVPGTRNGDGAIRCVYLANGASLSGFTLTNGATRVWEPGISDNAWSGGGVWCELSSAVVSNCVLAGNSAQSGGGAYGGTLNNCTLTGNSAGWGGGGAIGGTLNNCTLTGNSAEGGGGAAQCMLNNCMLTGNLASDYGGGAAQCMLNNCVLTGNSARRGGGAAGGTLNNCIVYFNSSPDGANYNSGVMNYCCTTPMPADGVGNITVDPQLADAFHVSATSPCRGAGSAAYATGTDIDDEAWATPPSIGCDEYRAGALTGPLSVSIAAAFTNAAAGHPLALTALIQGRTATSAWDFGDGVVVSNRPYATHAWTTPGDFPVVLRAYNESNPVGVSATVTVHVVAQPVHYVAASSANPLSPYSTWETAARTIQDAVDAAAVGGTVLVTNGLYATGGRALYGTLTNRLAVDKPLILRSVNGPEFTVIRGYQVTGTTNGDSAIRCVYLADGASLSGFTLTHGATLTRWSEIEGSGGGVWCASAANVVSNCVVAGNSAARYSGGAYLGTLNNCTIVSNTGAYGGGAAFGRLNNCTLTGNTAESGGGARWGTLNNCTLTGNSAGYDGGGADSSTLNNCTLTGNSAEYGGGVSYATLNNCIVYFNTSPNGANFRSGSLNYCCTTPLPSDGFGNITTAPLFVDYAGGNLRLQSNSPCINAGLNAYAPGLTDLDGLARIVSGTVDIGAYEFQGPGSVISYAWLQHYNLPTDGSADATDPDADGHTTWQEWRCLTDPTNTLSVLRLLSASPAGTNVTVTWQSVAGVSYFLERSTNLWASPPFTPLAPNLPGQPGTTSYTDTNATNAGPFFYRVGVGP